MPKQKTVIEQITKHPNGTLLIRFAKLRLENGAITGMEWHRTSIAPGQDIEHTLKAVNAHLVSIGESEIDTEPSEQNKLTPDFLRLIVKTLHMPEVIQKYQADIAAANTALFPRPSPSLIRRIISALTP